MQTPQTLGSMKKKSASVGHQTHNDLESMNDQIRDRYEELMENTKDASRNSFSFIKKYPFYTLAGVVAIGAAASMYLKSRRA